MAAIAIDGQQSAARSEEISAFVSVLIEEFGDRAIQIAEMQLDGSRKDARVTWLEILKRLQAGSARRL